MAKFHLVCSRKGVLVPSPPSISKRCPWRMKGTDSLVWYEYWFTHSCEASPPEYNALQLRGVWAKKKKMSNFNSREIPQENKLVTNSRTYDLLHRMIDDYIWLYISQYNCSKAFIRSFSYSESKWLRVQIDFGFNILIKAFLTTFWGRGIYL